LFGHGLVAFASRKLKLIQTQCPARFKHER
jgi:hypothetical protein